LEFTTIKGFKDILPAEVHRWQHLEKTARGVFHSFGFREIKPPLLERTELFSRSIGEETDIVSKEMYSLTDGKGRSLTLRPEATASVVRAYIQHHLYQERPVQKLFTIGPMFRHERPQKGRFRQFHQINAELFGDPGPKSDADLIIMAVYLFEKMGLSSLSLQLNSLGCATCRVQFKDALKEYLKDKIDSLCEDCRRRSETNPLRVFDCKVESCKQVVSNAPSILDFICSDCQSHFHALQGYLTDLDIPYQLNARLVRGLDYYSRTTFEIQTDRLGAQNAVAGGGRYDGLIRQLGGPDHTGIGFAVGVERLITLIEEEGESHPETPDLFIVALGKKAENKVFSWAIALRKRGFSVEAEYGPKGLKAQMKRADRLGAKNTLIVGENELAEGKAILRDMGTKVQQEIEISSIVQYLEKALVAERT
jgi:histidyl-tRNA synthetase